MSGAYTGDGRRRSSMTHARRGHKCSFCDAVSFGNGGSVAHSRSHVRRGEAVELVRYYAGIVSPSRLFVAADDAERIAKFLDDGFERETP